MKRLRHCLIWIPHLLLSSLSLLVYQASLTLHKVSVCTWMHASMGIHYNVWPYIYTSEVTQPLTIHSSSIPPIIGGGEAIKLVVAGLNRLFLKDPEREARVQAATFLVAYLLGLPCFCFSPNVLEAVRMSEVDELKELLTSTNGLNRLLIYLLAPVVVEESNHLQLIISDPRQARALVQIFRERNPELEIDGEAMLLWAFEEARRLLTANTGMLEKLRKRMESGGATVGDCVCVLETQIGRGGREK